jgi:glycosyltransferase involved in cell wall biosynthesis
MISIIIPNYNHEPFLDQRIQSVLNQTYQDFEVIILDDCSSDNSREVIEKYRTHPKVSHVIYNEINSGSTFKQWRKGIELAKGDWIWIAESDDYAEINFLEVMLSKKPRHDVSALICNMALVDSNNKTIMYYDGMQDEIIQSEYLIKKRFTTYNFFVNTSRVIFRKANLGQVNWEKVTQMKYCGDWLFWVMLIEKSHILTVRDLLSYQRNHTGNVGTLANVNGLLFTEGLMVVKWIFERHSLPLTHRIKVFEKWDTHYREKAFSASVNKKVMEVFYSVFNVNTYKVILLLVKYRKSLTKVYWIK